ncbi:hypothetical protein FNE27_03330 [Helicobacter pylori]|nr:hypothetical protein FNE27_03330 [Helicobacter pylori]
MPNTTAEKDYTQYSEKQLFNLMNKKEQELEKLKGIGRILKRKWLKS